MVALRVLVDGGSAPLARHLYGLPVLIAALRFGAPGGLLVALAVTMVEAPGLLSAIERDGLSAALAEAAVTCLTLLGAGGLVGAVSSDARRQRRRSETLLAVQGALGEEPALDRALARVRAALERRLRADVALAALDGDRVVLSGATALAPGSPAAVAIAEATAVFVADVGGGARARRALAVPMTVQGRSVGALVVEREGELGARERRDLAELSVALGLALEHARLAARQRRFTAELEEKVAAATRHLVAMDRAKTTLVALASHELRTPLTTLLGFSELLGLRAYTGEEVRRLAGIMRRETERLARLVEDFLDLERLERGQAPRLRRAPVAVAAAVEGAAELFRAGRASHRLEVCCEGELPALDADPDALDRVLKNLIANAMKYSPAGTTVRVSARRCSGGVALAVADEGRGIDPDVLPRIFEPYFRAPDAALSAPGSGLGLAVVKSLVEAHGGAIRAESAPGRGTRIVVEIPAVP